MTSLPRKQRPRLSPTATSAAADRGPALRFLPILIVAALVMLGVRIQVVVSDIASQRDTTVALSSSAALAQAQQPETPAAAPSTEGEQPAEEKAAEDTGEGEADSAATGTGVTPGAFNPSELTKSEIDTLQRLAERREIIERRERELTQKEGLVRAAEQRLDEKIAQMEKLEAELKGLVQQYDAKKQSEIEQLVRIYTAMKPKDAARIFDDLDMAILVGVVTNMKENKVAPILALMTPEKARQLTEELSTRRKLPGAQQGQQG
jgi:flagellar motility protein MotE (MotC chaperone)